MDSVEVDMLVRMAGFEAHLYFVEMLVVAVKLSRWLRPMLSTVPSCAPTASCGGGSDYVHAHCNAAVHLQHAARYPAPLHCVAGPLLPYCTFFPSIALYPFR